MNRESCVWVLVTGLPTLFLTACLLEPENACRTNDDCLYPRVCVALACQDHLPDASVDADLDGSSSGDHSAEVAIDAPTDLPEPSRTDGPGSDGPGSEAVIDPTDSAVDLDVAETDAHETAEGPDAWDAPQPQPGDDGGGASLDVQVLSEVLSVADGGAGRVDTDRATCDGACEPPSTWELVDSSAFSGPGVSRWGPGHNIDVFWRGADNHLKHRCLVDEQTWLAEEDLGGTLASDPATTSRIDNTRDVFWRGADDRLKHRSYPLGDGWSPEEDLGGTLASAPAAASRGTFALHVFWRGPDGLLKQRLLNYATNAWTAEFDLGIPVQADPAVIYRNNGVMDIFWRGPSGTLLHVWSSDGMNWSGVQDLGRSIAADSSPTAASREFEWVDVFWKGPDRHLKHVWMTPDETWSLLVEDLGGELANSPGATSWGLGQLDVFAKDSLTGQLAHLVWNREATLTLNDADPAINYSPGWLYSTYRPFVNYRDDVHYTMTDGAYFEHTFTGTGIDYVTDLEASSGEADIYVDGVFQSTINCSNPTRMVQQIVYSKRDLPSGSHTLKVVKANGDLMVLDALRVYP